MKLSIWSSYYAELSAEEAIQTLVENGITVTELSDEHGYELLQRDPDAVATGKKFAAFAKEAGMEIPQGHLWLRVQICTDPDALDILCKWVDLYEAIGIRNMVLHCDAMVDFGLSHEEVVERNIQVLRKLAAYIKDKEVMICLENLIRIVPNADEILAIIQGIGSPRFGVCLDTGHLNLCDKDQQAFIRKAGEKLQALHIADNDGSGDQHMMPFNRGNIDFFAVVKTLREIGYQGIFNMEIPGERAVPMEMKAAKIAYVKKGYDFLMKP
ncbi:MAG: sugar phosphate isomerase/epimerase [Clostridia bacterium]|nr:sugar phosphate isomerase/epimerase [Clostridia bacterium]